MYVLGIVFNSFKLVFIINLKTVPSSVVKVLPV